MITDAFDFGTFSIVNSALSSTSATFQIAATKSNQQGDGNYYEIPDTSITNFTLTVEEKGGSKKEKVGIASIADSGSTLSDGRIIYTLTFRLYSDGSTKMRGVIQNSDGTNNISNYDSDLVVSNFPVGSLVKMAWSRDYQQELVTLFNTNVANRGFQQIIFPDGISMTTGTANGAWDVFSKYDGNVASIARATVTVAGTTGDTTIQIHNVTTGEDILSTPITIASGATSGVGVIDAAQATLSAYDRLIIQVTGVSITPPKGICIVSLELEN